MSTGTDRETFDRPAVVAAVRTAFAQYERALAEGDVVTLTELFWDDERCVRFGVADRQRGFTQITAWRRAHPAVPPRRALHGTQVLGTGPGTAVVTTLFGYPAGRVEGRQTQVWVHTTEGWRIASAHVSEVPSGMMRGVARLPAAPAVLLAVAAAHRSGQSLHRELAALGAERAGPVLTAPIYRLLALDGRNGPPGGLVRARHGGARVEVELHRVPSCALGALLAVLVAPQVLGTVALDDGRTVSGFLLVDGTVGRDVTQHVSWPRYLRSLRESRDRGVPRVPAARGTPAESAGC